MAATYTHVATAELVALDIFPIRIIAEAPLAVIAVVKVEAVQPRHRSEHRKKKKDLEMEKSQSCCAGKKEVRVVLSHAVTISTVRTVFLIGIFILMSSYYTIHVRVRACAHLRSSIQIRSGEMKSLSGGGYH